LLSAHADHLGILPHPEASEFAVIYNCPSSIKLNYSDILTPSRLLHLFYSSLIVDPKMLIDSSEEFAAKKYDIVIISGGTAGLTLAARLTEDAEVTVGVI
jgi:hypothetical protein